jgi:hypothetical protein
LDASLFKTILINERLKLRFNSDFFNVLNHPGNPNSLGSRDAVHPELRQRRPHAAECSFAQVSRRAFG